MDGINYAAVLECALDVARAMLHLHCNNVVHADLKARNVMMLSAAGGDGRGVRCKVRGGRCGSAASCTSALCSRGRDRSRQQLALCGFQITMDYGLSRRPLLAVWKGPSTTCLAHGARVARVAAAQGSVMFQC